MDDCLISNYINWILWVELLMVDLEKHFGFFVILYVIYVSRGITGTTPDALNNNLDWVIKSLPIIFIHLFFLHTFRSKIIYVSYVIILRRVLQIDSTLNNSAFINFFHVSPVRNFIIFTGHCIFEAFPESKNTSVLTGCRIFFPKLVISPY